MGLASSQRSFACMQARVFRGRPKEGKKDLNSLSFESMPPTTTGTWRSSPLKPNPEPKPCKRGLECWRKGCTFKHPPGWSYDCPAAKAAQQKKMSEAIRSKDCRHGLDCWRKDCIFQHPKGWRFEPASSAPVPASEPVPAVRTKPDPQMPYAGRWAQYEPETLSKKEQPGDSMEPSNTWSKCVTPAMEKRP